MNTLSASLGGLKAQRLTLPLLPPLLFASVAWSQLATGMLSGTITDVTDARLPGANVSLASEALLGERVETTSGSAGAFRFVGLPPGTYTLEIRLPGFGTYRVEGIHVGAGDSVSQDVTLSLGIEEEVTVRSESPLVNQRQSGLATTYGPEFQENIPRLRTDFMDFARLAPGVSPARPTSKAIQSVSAFGSGVNENLFLIDGVDQTDTRRGILLSYLSTDSVQEVEIVSNGVSTEFGNYAGAVFNVVTRSGGIDWRLDGSYYNQSQALSASGPSQDCRCPSGETAFTNRLIQDATVEIGGPLFTDRVQLLANFQYRRNQENRPGDDPDFAYVSRESRFFEKLTFQVSPRFRLQQTWQDGIDIAPEPVSATVPAEVGSTYEFRGPVFGVGADYVINERTLLDANFSGNFKLWRWDPNSGSLTASMHADLLTGEISGGAWSFGQIRSRDLSLNATLTHYADEFLSASHQFKFGLQLKHGYDWNLYGYPGGGYYLDYGSDPYLKIEGPTQARRTDVDRLGLFVEDVLDIGERLNVNLGLRFDRNVITSSDVPEVDMFGEPTGETIEGLGTLFRWNVVSPRLGFTLALDEDATTLVRGSWGRFYQGGLVGEFQSFHPGTRSITTLVFDHGTGAYSTILDVFDPKRDQDVDRHLRTPRTDQLSFGLERQLSRDTVLGVTIVRKTGRDFTGWKDVGGVYGTDVAVLPDGQPLAVLPLLNDPSERFYLLTNPSKFHLDYDGLILAFRKRWSNRWQALASYTLSRAAGLQAVSPSLPGAQQESSGGFSSIWRDPNYFLNAEGNLTNERTHMFRVQANIDLPRVGVLLGGSFQYLSGVPWGAKTFVRLPQGPVNMFIEPQGSQRLPLQSLLDLRISKAFELGGTHRIELLADVLNVLNGSPYERVRSTNYFSPSFGVPLAYIEPRRIMVGVKATF